MVLTYSGIQPDRFYARKQAKDEINRVFPGLLTEVSANRWFKPQPNGVVESSTVSNLSNSFDAVP